MGFLGTKAGVFTIDGDILLELRHPNLKRYGYEIKSPQSVIYNCLAWAAHDVEKRWDPTSEDGYWPSGVPPEPTLDNVTLVFRTLGFAQCESPLPEQGFEKLAIYVDESNEPTHMARQLQSGKWTSKMGDSWDIEHGSLEALEDDRYGKVIRILKKPIATSE